MTIKKKYNKKLNKNILYLFYNIVIMPLLHKEYSKRAKYTPEYLKKICEENDIDCDFVCNDKKINRDSRIYGTCISENCNKPYETDFRSLCEKKIFYCKDCSNPMANKKREETCVKKYGVAHAVKSKEVQDKKEKTNMIRYGGKTPAHSLEVLRKIKEANDNKSFEEKQEIYTKRIDTWKQTRGIEYLDFSKESLCKLCDEQGIKLLDNEGNETNGEFYKNVTRNDIIYYKCIYLGCENKYNKVFRQFKEVSGAYCQDHTNKNMVNKCKNTYENNTGYDHPMHNPIHVAKVTNELRKTHDDTIKSAKIREQTKQTNLLNHGFKYPIQNKEIQEKRKQTCLKKYGVEHPAQNEEIMEKCSKNAYKRKDYELPSGNKIILQGCENFALDELLKDGILEDDIITGSKNVPKIWYQDNTKNKERRHYVDIFIPSQNRCIEIKSTWTAEKKKDCIFLKQNAAKKLGYLYEIWVYDNKGNKVELYN